MYSIPTQAPTPAPLQNKLSDRMQTSARKLSSSTEMTRSSSTIGPACGSSDRMSGMPISLSPEHERCVRTAEGERVAQDPSQRLPEGASALGHIQHRQIRIGHTIPQMRRQLALRIIILHR